MCDLKCYCIIWGNNVSTELLIECKYLSNIVKLKLRVLTRFLGLVKKTLKAGEVQSFDKYTTYPTT